MSICLVTDILNLIDKNCFKVKFNWEDELMI
jgi:hypothetical protein